MFDDEKAWYTELPETYIKDFTLINIDLSIKDLQPIGDLFDIVSLPTMIVLDKGDMVISKPLDEESDHHVVTYVKNPSEYHDLINSATFGRDMEAVPGPHRQEMGDHEEDHSHINIDYDMTKTYDGDLQAQMSMSGNMPGMNGFSDLAQMNPGMLQGGMN